jgi:CheY-like chemotaxis protein
MNTYLLGGLAVAGLLVLVAALLLRRRPRRQARDDDRATLSVDTAAADTPLPAAPPAAAAAAASASASAQAAPQAAPPTAAAHSVDAQRLAATEVLRQARQRKAEEAARLQAERQAEDQASAQAEARARAQAQPRTATPAPVRSQPAPAAPTPAASHPLPMAAARPAQLPPVARPVERITPVLSPLAINTIPTTSTSQPPAAAGLAPLRAPARPAGPPTVLLADDSKVVRVKTGRLLEKQGWRVLFADDGLAALRQLDAEGADLLITDVEMPGLDGFELTRRVRAHARWGRLPVIMITSSDDKHRAEAGAAGVNLLMGKPYEEEALLAQARQLLGAAAARTAPGLALH